MYKILHLIGGNADIGGVPSVVYNYMKYIDREKFDFDFTITEDAPGVVGRELVKWGANCYKLPIKTNGIRAYRDALFDLLSRNHYDIIHAHDSCTSYLPLMIAQKAGVPGRIAHSHMAPITTSKIGQLKRVSGIILNPRYATAMIGCGIKAGEYAFGKEAMKKPNAYILPNAIDTKQFKFDNEIREKVRKENSLQNRFVVGMIGRLAYPKNHKFALNIVKNAIKSIPNIILLLVGDGEDENEIRRLINELHIEPYVKMVGKTKSAEQFYQAFDVCILPSWFEGFPVVAVEAMASGLPILLSDTITDELGFYSAAKYLSLNSVDDWVASLNEFKDDVNRNYRQNEVENYDIGNCVQILEKIYLGSVNLQFT